MWIFVMAPDTRSDKAQRKKRHRLFPAQTRRAKPNFTRRLTSKFETDVYGISHSKLTNKLRSGIEKRDVRPTVGGCRQRICNRATAVEPNAGAATLKTPRKQALRDFDVNERLVLALPNGQRNGRTADVGIRKLNLVFGRQRRFTYRLTRSVGRLFVAPPDGRRAGLGGRRGQI